MVSTDIFCLENSLYGLASSLLFFLGSKILKLGWFEHLIKTLSSIFSFRICRYINGHFEILVI